MKKDEKDLFASSINEKKQEENPRFALFLSIIFLIVTIWLPFSVGGFIGWVGAIACGILCLGSLAFSFPTNEEESKESQSRFLEKSLSGEFKPEVGLMILNRNNLKIAVEKKEELRKELLEMSKHGKLFPEVVCTFCQTKGKVRVKKGERKEGLSGGKVAGGMLTGGASILVTGIHRKQEIQNATCGNCRQTWSWK